MNKHNDKSAMNQDWNKKDEEENVKKSGKENDENNKKKTIGNLPVIVHPETVAKLQQMGAIFIDCKEIKSY